MSEQDARHGIYAEVGANYRAIDELRLRLLGLLPLATGTGVFLLLKSDASAAGLVAAGVFGVLATISLFFYELHGVEKCAHFIHRGEQIEKSLGVRGSFTMRPHKVSRVASELLPSKWIYPASLAGWLYLALEGVALDGSPTGSPHLVRGFETTHLAAAGLGRVSYVS